MSDLVGPGRTELVGQLGALIARFAMRGREPDRWESFCLVRALDNLSVGHLGEVNRQLALARLPAELRPPDGFRRIPQAYRAMTAEGLRGALVAASERPRMLHG
jgi:hypothetical protein